MRHPARVPAPETIWPTLAQNAGLNPDAYDLTSEWVQSDAGRESHVCLYSSANRPPVVLKQIARSIPPEQFSALVQAQEQTAKAMGDGLYRVPRVLAVDLAAQSFLMEAATGLTAFVLLEADDHHEDVLSRCGGWLDTFHRTGFEEERTFRPQFNRKQIRDLASEVRSGEKEVPNPDRFLTFADRVADSLSEFEGRQTVAALGHGDMNLRNLLLGEDTVWGIDITRNQPAPVGYDIVRLLLHYTLLLSDLSRLAPGDIVPAAAMKAFFGSYRLVTAADPSVQTLLRVRLLNDWARLPVRRWDRTMRENFRLRRIQLVLENAFPK